MKNERVGADISGHHQPAPVHLLTQRPDVYGQRGQVTAGWDQNVSQEDRTTKVQRDKATSSWGERITEKIYFGGYQGCYMKLSYCIFCEKMICNNDIVSSLKIFLNIRFTLEI